MVAVKLTIIIVSYNTKDLTEGCLNSLGKVRAKDWEIIVVDNASTDGSRAMLASRAKKSEILTISNKTNVGYGAANNQGMKKARGEYILLLNSDTVASEVAISKMISFIEARPKAGVVTCKLVLADGTIDPACHRGFPTPWASLTYMIGAEREFPHSRLFGQYHLGYLPMDLPHKVDAVSGAFFLVRKRVLDEVGLFDENFFMYGEDLDLAYRIRGAGWKIWYNPDATVLHLKKQSGRANADDTRRKVTQKYFYETMRLFYKKHYAKKYGFLVNWFVNAAISIRLFLSSL